jgi:dienelactone hydrolase
MISSRLAQLLALFPALLALLAAPAAQSSDVATSYAQAIVYAPGGRGPMKPAQISEDRKFPVVVLLHGCAGIGSREQDAHKWAAHIAAAGYLAILPDSLARNDRPASCDRKSRTVAMFPGVFDMRRGEVEYAASQIRQAPWYDGRTLILMGYSEGAIVAVTSKLEGFTAVIATSWTCNIKFAFWLDGISVANSVPLLTLAHEKDPWFKHWIFNGSCADRFEGRTDARHVAIPGEGHGTFRSPIARKAVSDFLGRFHSSRLATR